MNGCLGQLQDVEDVVIRGIAIVVDITQQTELLVAVHGCSLSDKETVNHLPSTKAHCMLVSHTRDSTQFSHTSVYV